MGGWSGGHDDPPVARALFATLQAERQPCQPGQPVDPLMMNPPALALKPDVTAESLMPANLRFQR
jgi:hypothetical protein